MHCCCVMRICLVAALHRFFETSIVAPVSSFTFVYAFSMHIRSGPYVLIQNRYSTRSAQQQRHKTCRGSMKKHH